VSSSSATDSKTFATSKKRTTSGSIVSCADEASSARTYLSSPARRVLTTESESLLKISDEGSVGRCASSAAGSVAGYRAAWRTEVFIEYYYCAYNDKCVADCTTPHSYPDADEECGDLQHGTACWSPVCQTDCYRTEDEANNFIGLRRPPLDGVAGADVLYAEFQRGDLSTGKDVAFDDVDFTEYYDTAADPWQLSNLAERADTAAARAKLHTRLHEWFGCAGDACP